MGCDLEGMAPIPKRRRLANDSALTASLQFRQYLEFWEFTVPQRISILCCERGTSNWRVGVMKKLPLPFSVHRLNGVQRSPFMETTFISSQPAGWPAGQPFSEQTAFSNLHHAG